MSRSRAIACPTWRHIVLVGALTVGLAWTLPGLDGGGLSTGGVAWADPDIPDKAVCTTCSMRGSMHGEEKVADWREYEGEFYYFCSKDCGKAFDGFPQAYIAHPIPRPAPQLTLLTPDSEPLEIAGETSGVQLLDFWATWCSPCLEAMPKLEKLQRKYGDQGFTVVGISIDEDIEKFAEFLKKKPTAYPMVYDSGPTPAWQQFYVAAIPAMVLIDAEGRIIGEWRGKPDLGEISARIEAMLAQPRE